MSFNRLQLTVLAVTTVAEHPPRQPGTAAEAERYAHNSWVFTL
jgi:hypothetical protein